MNCNDLQWNESVFVGDDLGVGGDDVPHQRPKMREFLSVWHFKFFFHFNDTYLRVNNRRRFSC